jgi:hypothetical protein
MLNIEISKEEYLNKKPYPYYSQDNILEEEFALNLQKEIFNIKDENWDRFNNPFEKKICLKR